MTSTTQKNNSNTQVVGKLNITPLVDVILTLALAFFVTFPLLGKSLKISQPETVATQQPAEFKNPVGASGNKRPKI